MRQFSLFQSHIDFGHYFWKQILRRGDWAIDATCGNGNDTYQLAEILAPLQGQVIAMDLQERAIICTKERLAANACSLAPVHLFCQCHTQFPSLALENPIRLIVYNLGYLPKADKTVTTQVVTTLQSAKIALSLVMPGGAICITCYPGHNEGNREQEALLQSCSLLDPALWNVCFHHFVNRIASPNVLLIQRSKN